MIAVLCFCDSLAQDQNVDFEQIIERLLPAQDLDVDYNDLYDRLVTLYSDPLDLNRADRQSLQSLYLFTEDQIAAILAYREKYGDFLTLYELMSIDGLDKETIEQAAPFITVVSNPKITLRESLKSPDRNELFFRLQTTMEQKKGYTEADTTSTGKISSRYAGDPYRLYARYIYANSEHYSFGFTLEKDPGEKLIYDKASSRYGMDYYSLHGMVKNIGPFKQIVVGDFTMDFGQSLVFGSGLQMGKGYETITTIRRSNSGLRPYRSVYENKDFSGIALSAGTARFEINAFYSIVKRDAILKDNEESNDDQFITYIQTIGLHRTPSEISAKQNIEDRSFGANLHMKSVNDKLEIGANAIQTTYSVPLIPGNKKYNQFEFRGMTNTVASAYFNYHLRKAHIFGEAAASENKGKAFVGGIIANLSSQVQTSFLLRHYDRNFHSFHAAGFGENSKTINEQGIYWGLRVKPVKGLTLSTYYDFYLFPWLKYQVDSPSRGRDFMISALYEPKRALRIRFQLRNKIKQINLIAEDDPFTTIQEKSTTRFLMDMAYDVNANFSIKTRVQFSNVNFSSKMTKGFIMAQDVKYSHNRLGLSARFALFDTDDYDNRQFIYEHDLLYVYSVPFFYRKGARYYLLGKFDVSKKISIWIKYSQTKYVGLKEIGTGLETIQGDKISNLGFQVRVKI